MEVKFRFLEDKLAVIETWHMVKLDPNLYNEYKDKINDIIKGRYYLAKSGNLYCEHQEDTIFPALKWSTK